MSFLQCFMELSNHVQVNLYYEFPDKGLLTIFYWSPAASLLDNTKIKWAMFHHDNIVQPISKCCNHRAFQKALELLNLNIMRILTLHKILCFTIYNG